MSLLWLKKLDKLSQLAPKKMLRAGGESASGAAIAETAIVRPGGLGDMVILTRALIESGLDPRGFTWFAERRNSTWLDYLGISYKHYHDWQVLIDTFLGKDSYEAVLCTEQFHGLAAVFSARLAGRQGELSGFSINPRADLFDKVCDYAGHRQHELDEFKSLLELYALNASSKGPSTAENFTLPTRGAVDIEGDYTVLALAGLSHPHKSLPLEIWKKLYKRALGRSSKVVIVGSKAEAGFSRSLEAALEGEVINRVGKQSFSQTVDLIRSSKRLISVDSGLVHVADFFQVQSDVVFAWNSPAKWGPITEGSQVLKLEDL